MKKRALLLMILAAVALWAEPLTRGERDRAMSELHATRKLFLDAIAGLSPAQWNFKPAPEVWSIAEVAEHIALSEPAMMDWAKGTLARPTEPGAKATRKDEEVLNLFADRSQKAKAPAALVPARKFANAEAVAADFRQRRAATIAYVDQTQDDLRAHLTPPQGGFGGIDVYQLLLGIAGHTHRHIAQINEVKANPKYPKK